jgi:hypothetical protein
MAFHLEVEVIRLRLADDARAEDVEIAVAGRLARPAALEQAEGANLSGRPGQRIGARQVAAP